MCKEQSPQSKTNSGHSTKLQAMGCCHTIHDTKSWQLEEGTSKQARKAKAVGAGTTGVDLQANSFPCFYRVGP